MTATAARRRSEFDEREPTEKELLAVTTEYTQDLLLTNTRLEAANVALGRMVKSLTSRSRAMERALAELVLTPANFRAAPAPLGVYTDMPRLLVAAQTTEALGDVAAVRWTRNESGTIVGVELSYIAPPEGQDAGDEFDPTFRALATLALHGATR